MKAEQLRAIRERAAAAAEAIEKGEGGAIALDVLREDVPQLLTALERLLREPSVWRSREDPSPETPTIVTLCGSTRFLDAFRQAKYEETLAGRIVLTVGHDYLSDDELFSELPAEERDRIKASLDDLHLRKIEISDEILVLNVRGYVGKSTGEEIAHARKLGKRIRWLEPDKTR